MNYIIYDLEATCWDGNPPELRQEIIEIGAYKISRFGEVLDSFSRFVKPQINPFLSPFCLRLTHIEQSDINKANSFPSVVEDFQDWIGIYDDEYILASWGKYDQKQFNMDCELHRIESDWTEAHINLKQQYAHIKKLSKQIGLAKAVRTEGFEFTGTQHRAIFDAENLAKIFMKYIEEWDIYM